MSNLLRMYLTIRKQLAFENLTMEKVNAKFLI